MPVADAVALKTDFFFAVLICRRESPRWGVTYVARSILTGSLAEARTEEEAVESLMRTIELEMSVAAQLGVEPERWYLENPPDDRKHIDEFCRRAGPELVRRPVALRGPAGPIHAHTATVRSVA